MISSPGLGVVTIGCDLSVQSWNQWLAEVTGRTEAEVIGQPLLSLVPPQRAALVRSVLEDVMASGRSRVLAPVFHQALIACPVREQSPYFSEMQQFVTFAPLNAEGRIVGAIITIEDVTAQRDRDRALTSKFEAGELQPNDALAAVGAADWRVRGAAVRTLRQQVSTAEVAHLLGALRRGYMDFNVVSSALQVLTAANRDVTAPLVELLSDPETDLRMHAALALGRAGDHAAIPALVRALDDVDANVRFHAIEALGLLGAGDAVEPLARIAQSADFYLAFPAIDALAKADDARVAPALVALLDNPLLRPALIQTLAMSGDEDAVAPLVGIVNTDAESVTDAASALVRIRDRYEDAFAAGAQIVELTRAALTAQGRVHLAEAVSARRAPLAPAVTVLGWEGTAALESMLAVLGEPAVEAIAAEAIVAMGHAAVEPLVARLTADDRGARLAAATLLGAIGDSRAVGPLIAALETADAELAAAAAAALARLGDPSALDALLPLFAHTHPMVRQAALAAVNAIGADATASRVAPRLSAADPRVRACAIRVAGYFGFEELVSGILHAVDDSDEDVRRAALEQLPMLDDPRAVARLIRAVADETPRNRAAAAHALRSVERAVAVSPLIDALGDRDMWVRYFAAGAIGWRRDRAAAPRLARLVTDDPAPHVRIAALQALAAVDAAMAATVARSLVADAERDVAAAALAAIAADSTIEAGDLIEDAVRCTDLIRRNGAVRALARARGARAVELLAWAARAGEVADVARLAIESLGQLCGSPDQPTHRAAIAALVDLAAAPATRESAIAALVTHVDAVDHLSSCLSSPRESARVAVIEILARMRTPRASDALVAALGDQSAAVRGAAIAAFGRLGTSVAADAIAALSRTDADAGVRRLAATVCRRHRWAVMPETPAV